jgi:hypothetical protein
MSNPHRPPREDGLTIYPTERGYVVRASVGRLSVTIEGCADEDEAASAATATLDALAARRGVRPARDRTPRRLLDALRVP